jgi:chaperonin cofactor prefoldin
MLADDDDAARLMIGNSFWVTPKEDAEGKLEELTEGAKAKMTGLEEQLGGVKEEMAALKVKLYATFGSNINLEE